MSLLKGLGTEQVINYSCEKLRDRVRELTGGKGADVIIDPVGGELFDQAIRAIAWGGRPCVLGFASGQIPKLSISQALLKSFDLVGFNYGGWVDNDSKLIERRRNSSSIGVRTAK